MGSRFHNGFLPRFCIKTWV